MSSPVTLAARIGPLLPAGDPRIVGIVNITEDSFSDGGRYLDSGGRDGATPTGCATMAPISSSWAPPPAIRDPCR